MPFFPEAPLLPPVPRTADFDGFLTAYRASVPNLRKFLYLNHASVGPLSDWVVDATQDMLRQQQMAETTNQNDWFDGWRQTRQRVGEMLGAGRAEMCLQGSTYLGCLRVLNALPLGPGDEVVYPADEFPSLYHALSEVRLQGATLVCAESSRGDGIVRTDDLLNAMTPRTKLLATSWVNFVHGYRHDLHALGQACRERGAWFLIDVIQGLGMLELNVKECGVHFVAGQGAKWMCAPLASGYLYVSGEVPPEITPRQEGWFAMELNHLRYTDRSVKPKLNANRFATGTVDLPSAYGLRRACEVFLAAGLDKVEARAVGFADRLAAAALDSGVPVYSDRAQLRSAILSLDIEQRPHLPGMLQQQGVVFSVREGRLRLSPHWYHLDDEIDRICEIIRASATTAPSTVPSAKGW